MSQGHFSTVSSSGAGFKAAATHQQIHDSRGLITKRRDSSVFLIGWQHPFYSSCNSYYLLDTKSSLEDCMFFVFTTNDLPVGPDVPGAALALLKWPDGDSPPTKMLAGPASVGAMFDWAASGAGIGRRAGVLGRASR